MTKNKKKLRRAERRYSVTKSAQTLVLAGMLLAGGVSGAMAAATDSLSGISDSANWAAPAADAGADQSMTGASGGKTVGTSADGTVTFGTLTINGSGATPGADDVKAIFNVKNSLSFGNVSVLGTAADASNRGGFAELNISGGTTNNIVFTGGSLAIAAGDGNGGAAVAGGNSTFTLGDAAATKTTVYNANGAVSVTAGNGGATNTAASAGGAAAMTITGGLTAGTADATFNGNGHGLSITGGNNVASGNAASNGGAAKLEVLGTTATAAGVGGGAYYNDAGDVSIVGGNDLENTPTAGAATLDVKGANGGSTADFKGGVAELSATSILVKNGAFTSPGTVGGTATLNVQGGTGGAAATAHAGAAKITTESLTIDATGGVVTVTGGAGDSTAANGSGGNAELIVSGDFLQKGGTVTINSGTTANTGAANGEATLQVDGTATVQGGTLILGDATTANVGGGILKLGSEGLTVGAASAAGTATTILKSLGNTGTENKIYGNVNLDHATLELASGTMKVLTTDPTSADLGTVSITNNTVLKGATGKLVAGTLDVQGNVIKSAASGDNVNFELNKLQLAGATTLGQAADNGTQAITIIGTGAGAEFLTGGDLTLTGNNSSHTATLTLAGEGKTDNNILLKGKNGIAQTLLNVGKGGQTNATNMDVNGITVGDATDFGTLTLAGAAAANGTTLNVTTLSLGANGAINIGANSTLNMDNALSIATTKLKAATATAGEIAIADGGVLYTKGGLTLTGASSDVSTIAGEIIAPTVTVNNTGTADGTLTWDGATTSQLTLLGATASGEFLNANTAALNVKGGTVNFGKQGTAYETVGGISTKNVLVSHANGTLNVAAGDWQINQLNVSAGKALIAGNLTIGDITNNTALQSAVAGNGTAVGVTTAGINVIGSGSLTVSNKTLVDGSYAKLGTVGKIWLDSAATLKITGYDSIALADAKTLYGNVVAGTGLVKYGDTTEITIADTDKWQATDNKAFLTGSIKEDKINSTGVVLKGESVGFSGNNNITTGGYGADNLKSDATTGTVAVTLNKTLTLLGKVGGVDLVQTAGATPTNIKVDGNALNLGNAFTTADTSGTLKGNIALATNGSLNVTNGSYTVGDITTANDDDGSVNINSGSLTTGKIGTSATADLDVKMAGGILNATDAAFVDVADLTGGTLQSTGEGAKGNLTIGSFAQTKADGTPDAGKVSNAKVLADGNFVLTADGIDAKETSFGIKGNMTATNQTINADASTLNVGGKLDLGTGALSLTESTGTVGQLTTGAVSLTKGSNITLSATDAAKASSVASLVIGEAVDKDVADSGSSAHLDVKGKLNVTGATDIFNGSTVTVNELNTNGLVTVGSKDDTKGSSLVINKLTAGSTATFFVDPFADNSIVQVKDTTAALTQDFIAGNNGIVSFGQRDMAWAKAQIAESGMDKPSVLVMASNVTLGTGAQILVGDKYEADGKWNNAATADNYGLALRGNSLVIADMSKADGVTPGIKLTSGTPAERNVLIEKTVGVRLYADKLQANQNALLVSGIGQLEQVAGTAINSGTLDVKHASTTNMLVGIGDIMYDKSAGTLNASTYAKKASSMLPNISSSMGSYLEHMAVTPGFDTTSDNMGIKFVSRALDNRFIGTNNAEQAAATIEGAAQLAVVGAAPAMTLSAVQAGTSTVTTRTSFASPLMDSSKAVALHKDVDGTLSVDSGLNAGNGMKNGFGLWIMPLYQSNSAWGMKADGFKGGYKSDLGGVALGADYTFNDMFRLGLAFNIGGGYAESNGDFNKTENSFNFWGINAYGGWTMNNFGITADVGYTGNYNKLEQELPGAMGMSDIKSDVNSSAWTAGLRGEYKFATEALDIIPHVGVRYTGLTTDEYKAKSGGETVFKVDQDFQSIWTFPIGVTLAKEIETGSGWIIRPQVDLGITPATGDVKAKSKVRIPGVDGQAEMKMQVVDYMSYDGGVGLEMKKDNVSFGINYNIQASEHRTGHGVFGTFRYEF